MAEDTHVGQSRLVHLRRAITRYELFLLAAGLWFLGKFVRYAFPPLFDEIQGAYGITSTEMGLAYSAFFALYAITQFPSGAFADRFGSVQVITGGALVAGAGALWVLLTPPFALMVAAMAIIGAGTGAHKTVSIRLLSNIHPSHLGRALGVFDTIGAFGGVVAPLLVAAVLGYGLGGWPAFFGATGVAFVVGAAAFYGRTRRRSALTADPEGTEQVIPWRSYRRTFRRPRVVAFAFLTILFAFAYNGLVSFLPLMLTVEGNVTPAIASVVYSVLFAASVVQIVSGEAADRFGPLRTITVSLGLATIGIGSLLGVISLGGGELSSLGGLIAVGGVVLLIGVGAHGYRPARDVYVVSILPEATTGGTLGVIRTLLMGSAAISPTVIGYLGDRFGFFVAFIVILLVAGSATMLALVLGVYESYRQRP